MSQGVVIGFWLGLAVIAANLPWLSERWLWVITRKGRPKPFWLRLVEWGLLYGLTVGMGVGLALSHATIERLHGELWTRPADGQGARVGFRLPLHHTETTE